MAAVSQPGSECAQRPGTLPGTHHPVTSGVSEGPPGPRFRPWVGLAGDGNVRWYRELVGLDYPSGGE